MSTSENDVHPHTMRRREALRGAGGLGASAIWSVTTGPNAVARGFAKPQAASAAVACILTPEVTEGPYWIPNHLTRRDITEHKPGLPLRLQITVVHANRCTGAPHADVEVWQADALGMYSGYSASAIPGPGGTHATPTSAKRFLRGHQKTDARGRVLFERIYPGWYPIRAPHIHLKVHVGGRVVHTGQLFFPDPLSGAVYGTGVYAPHGQAAVTNRTDSYYAGAGGSRAQLHLSKHPHRLGYTGQITVGLAT